MRKRWIIEETGEVRKPKMGERFLYDGGCDTDLVIGTKMFNGDESAEFPIVTVQAEEIPDPLKRCPCCKSTLIEHRTEAPLGGNPDCYTWCGNCGLRTRNCDTHEESDALWNQRA